jgi:3-(3-hydroxy-phenyl)propionate hydroxylase
VNHYQIAIVGAGPAGLVLANLLGVQGIRTLLVERNAGTVGEPRAVSIDDESLRTLQAIGLVQTALGDIVQGYGAHYYSPKGRCYAKVQPVTREYGYPRRNAFRQQILERQLHEGLSRFPHIEQRFSHKLESLHQDQDKVTLEARTPEGTVFTASCDYLVGCDGASSKVRELLGIKLQGTTFAERWLIVDMLGTPDRFRHTRVYCDPARPAISLPGPHGTRRYEFMLHAGERQEDFVEEALVRKLVGACSPADSDLQIVRKVVYTFHARVAERWGVGRAFLAGDAAHLSPPFAGQGMNSGVRDSLNLAWKLAAVCRGELGAGLLDSYELERKPHAWALIEMAMAIGRFMMPKNNVEALLMQTALRSLAIYPPARDYVMQMKFKPKPRFEKGFVIPEPGKASSWSGRLFIQPEVELADGRRVLMDEVLGKGFSLVLPSTPGEKTPAVSLPDGLRAHVLRVIPQDYNFPLNGHEGESTSVVRDCTGALETALAPYGRSAVLLRPDRYVCAVIPLGGDARPLRELEALVAGNGAAGGNTAGRYQNH